MMANCDSKAHKTSLSPHQSSNNKARSLLQDLKHLKDRKKRYAIIYCTDNGYYKTRIFKLRSEEQGVNWFLASYILFFYGFVNENDVTLGAVIMNIQVFLSAKFLRK